jgi:6-phosphogluconolactonase
VRINLSVAALVCTACAWADPSFVYTNNNSTTNTVSAFSVATNGSLSPVPGSPFATGGSGGKLNLPSTPTIATTVAKDFLYVSNLGTNNVSAFSINASTGVLTPIPGSPFPIVFSRTFGLAITPDDRFLIITDGNGGRIAVESIAANGSLTPVAGSPFTTPLRLTPSNTAVPKVTQDGRFLAVGSIINVTGGVVVMFDVSSNGTPIPLPSSGWGRPGEVSAIDCNCAGNQLYTVAIQRLQHNTRADVFDISSTGALVPIAGSPFTGPAAGASNAVLSPDDTKLFVSNADSSEITVFSVSTNGSLMMIPGSPFPAGGVSPGSLATNRAGTFLFAAQTYSNLISAFSIAANGALTPVTGSPFSTGTSGTGPLSLTVFPPKSCCSLPPSISGVSMNPTVPWPPNHRMVEVEIDYAASASCPNTCVLTVSSNEPVSGAGNGKTSPDWEVVDTHHVLLRAERTGNGGDRIYTVTITCSNDSNELSSVRTVVVQVPHDKRK